ncbi:MAG TPA: hypothetical protein VIC84_00535 [Blastocatellia bacterium]
MFHFMLRVYRFRRRAIQGTALLLITALLLSACGEIPDISKFAEASAGMTGAIRKGFTQTDELLGDSSSGSLFDPDTSAKLKEERKNLRDSIQPTLNMLDAIDGYLDALQTIAAARKKSAEQSEALVSAVGNVVNAASGIKIPEIAINIADKLVTLYNNLRLEKDFRKRVNLVAEIMEGKKDDQGKVIQPGAINLLKQNVIALRGIGDSVCETVVTAIEVRNSIITDYHDQILENDKRVQRVLAGILEHKNFVAEFSDFENKINLTRDYKKALLSNQYKHKLAQITDQNKREEIEAELRQKHVALDQESKKEIERRKAEDKEIMKTQLDLLLSLDEGLASLKNQLAEFDSPAPRTDMDARRRTLIMATLEQRETVLLGQTKALTGDLQRINPAYNEVITRLDQVRAKQNSLNDLLTKSASALDAWAETHARLRATLNTRQPLTASQLIGAVREMLEILTPENRK